MLILRYLFKNLLTTTFFVAVTLTLVIWLTQSLKFLDLIANSDAPIGIFFKLVALTLPRFLEIILPASLVCSLIFTYYKCIQDNELVVLRACGFDQYALARPAIILALGVTFVMYGFSLYLAPKSYAQMQQLRQNLQTQYSSFLLREGVFNTFGKNLTVYLRARDKDNGDLLGIVIHDTRASEKTAATVTAKRGRIVMNGDTPSIEVIDGLRQSIDAKTGQESRLYFARYAIEIKGVDNAPGTRWREASERTFIELLSPDMNNPRDVQNRSLFLVEAQIRLLSPLNTLGFCLVGLCFILLGPFNRRGHANKVMGASLSIVLLQASFLALASAAKKQPPMIIFLYLQALVPVMAGFLLLDYRGEAWLTGVLRWLRRLTHARSPAT
jgi:lipopolysaccharide export system permease protein